MTRVFKENVYNTACIVPSNNTSTANKSITVYLPSSSGTLQIASSDIKLKDNINECEISDAISFINKIHLHSFDWKTDGYHQPIGFVADELKELDNNLSIGGNSDELDENGLPIDPKCVNTFYLQGYEVKAIQELSSKIDNKVDALEKENNKLKDIINQLLERVTTLENK
nr:MAG TPA: endosialidase chaperone [Caudoviricetes sp.]